MSAPRRILYVQHTADLYGASRALLHLVEALDRERYAPLVALPADGPLVGELRALGVEPLIAPYLQTLWGQVVRSWRVVPFGLRLLPSALATRRLIRRQQADLVHSNVWTILSGALGARLAGAPHVWHVREILPHSGGLKPALVALSLRTADRLICVSESVAAQFAGRRGAERVRVVYDGLPLEVGRGMRGLGSGARGLGLVSGDEAGQQAPSPKPQATGVWQAPSPEPQVPGDNELRIGVVGRLHPQKGQADLLRAFALLDPGLRSASRVLLAGGASPGHERQAEELAALARDLGIAERVSLLGFVADTRDLIASLDLLVLPATRAEGLGGVLLEAMAARVPVLSTRAGGTAEVVDDEETGLLVPPQQPAALARALARLLGDPQLRRRLGAAGRRAVEQRFGADSMARQVERIYAELLG